MVVGHSLGSVVAYDVLNRLLIDHLVKPDTAPEIAKRTRLFLTFGSPLDKTAFIFGAQGAGTEAREALAASVQPLISDAQVRPRWVNIYSTWDIISGLLDFYDLPVSIEPASGGEHQGLKGDDASGRTRGYTWRNETLFETLVEALRPAPPGHGATF